MGDLKYVVTVRPGSAAVKPLRFVLPEDKLTGSIDAVLKYGLNDVTHARAAARLVESVNGEMKGQYGITVNDTAVIGADPIRQYFTERTAGAGDAAQTYLGVDIIVASKQTGGMYSGGIEDRI